MASGVQKTAEAKPVKKAATAWPRVRPRRKVSERIAPAKPPIITPYFTSRTPAVVLAGSAMNGS
ncbi:hypothetical protein D3C72_1278650 [compost metagenome]